MTENRPANLNKLLETRQVGSQHDRILSILRAHPQGVCGVTFLGYYIPTYSQRIGELRHNKGYTINVIPCPWSHHTHNSNIGSYQLVEGINAGQEDA